MKMKYALLTGCLAITALGACVSEDRDLGQDNKADKGRLALNVTRTEPMQTRAVTEVSDYPVFLYDANGAEVKRWDAVTEVPATYVLSVGNYTVESHTPGIIQKKMTTPYYKGSAEVEILKDTKTNANVVCKMQNSPITVHYVEDFLSVFTAWEITLDDGGTTALSFTEADGTTPATIYWHFEEAAEKLTLNFRGTTADGSTIVQSYVLTKDQAVEHYDGDSKVFTGGDALNINFTPVEATSGHVTAITINADVTFTETNSKLTLEVTDNGTLTPDIPGDNPGDNPQPGDNTSITLDLPAPISYPFLGAAAVEKSLGDTYIAAGKGLKSIIVKIESTSEEMISSVGDLNTNYGVDFIGGAEIVGNQKVVTLFQDLNQPLDVPAEGDTEYTFPIGNFFELLQVLVGEHTFHLTVTDLEGNTKSGTVTITITM